jgi:hypothetical protein
MKRFIVVGSFLVMGVCAIAQLSRPVQFTSETFDFGQVIEENGSVSHDFVFTNRSNKPVQVLSVKPSCGCTTPGWTKEPIAPGKTGIIQAAFDPKGRPGYFNKSLTVMTDAGTQPVMLYIKGTVISNISFSKSEFQAASGSLRLRSLSFNLGKVYRKDEFNVRKYEVYNAGKSAVTYKSVEGPSYIRVDMEPQTLAPDEKGMLTIRYNGKQKDQYGFQSDNIVVHTTDELMPAKSFTVYATLEDYFPEMKPEELAKAPRLQVGTETVEFGSMKQHQPLTREVVVTNTGRSVLEIRSVLGNCTCIITQSDKETLKAGERAVITITFDPQDRKGSQNKSVTVYTNDPRNPVQRITLKGIVD